jgi:hypothetical protein
VVYVNMATPDGGTLPAFVFSDTHPLSLSGIAYHVVEVDDELLRLGNLKHDLEFIGGKLLSLFP